MKSVADLTAMSEKQQPHSASEPRSIRPLLTKRRSFSTDHFDFRPYSQEERMLILGVIKKDLELRKMEKYRLQKLRHSILVDDKQSISPQKSQCCVICESAFVVLFNAKLICDLCGRAVCKRCSNVYPDVEKTLCKLCNRVQFYKAMIHTWFYDNAPNKFSDYASNVILKDIFKDKLPPVKSVTDEQLHSIVALYLGPTRNAVINGKLITPELMSQIKNEQLNNFRTEYKSIREKTLMELAIAKSDHRSSIADREKRIEAILQEFGRKSKTQLNQLLQSLCITTEKNNIALGLDSKHTNGDVLHAAQKEIESIVGHPITLPPEFLEFITEDDWETYVGSVTGGPEEFFSKFLLEDIKNAVSEQYGYQR